MTVASEMARAPRLYVPLDLGFFDDVRVMRAGEKAGWLYLNMLTKTRSSDTDGVLFAEQLAKLGVPQWKQRLAALIREGLVTETVADCYVITNWTKWNQTAAEREEAKRAEAKRKADARAKAARDSDGRN